GVEQREPARRIAGDPHTALAVDVESAVVPTEPAGRIELLELGIEAIDLIDARPRGVRGKPRVAVLVHADAVGLAAGHGIDGHGQRVALDARERAAGSVGDPEV